MNEAQTLAKDQFAIAPPITGARRYHLDKTAKSSAKSSGSGFVAADMIKQFSRFTLVGAVATSAHFLMLVFLVQGFEVNPVHASASGFACGALVGYILNYRITFRSSKRHWQTLPKFGLVALSGLAVNTLIMYGLINRLSAHYLGSQLVATGVVLIWNFSVNRWWTFGEARSAEHG